MCGRKHAHVSETLTTGERLAPVDGASDAHTATAPFAILAGNDPEPIAGPARCALDWDGDAWVETDPRTGAEIARGTIERRPE